MVMDADGYAALVGLVALRVLVQRQPCDEAFVEGLVDSWIGEQSRRSSSTVSVREG